MRLLAGALAANAVFSGASGILLALAGGQVARVLGDVPAWSVRAVGLGLVAFAALVAAEARRPRGLVAAGIIVADGLWVAGSLGLLVLAPGWLAREGTLLVGCVAAVVAALALGQWVGLKHAARGRTLQARSPRA